MIVEMVNPEMNHFSMEETIIEDTPKGEQHFHTPFTGKEMREVVFQMIHNNIRD
jgi:hypothetical protein